MLFIDNISHFNFLNIYFHFYYFFIVWSTCLVYNKFKLFEQTEVSKYIQKGEICHGKFNYRTKRNRKNTTDA